MKVNVFAAKCITNLHVGNGDVNYNIIDQEVERDPITELPIIHPSGIKGAMREFFEGLWGKEDGRIGSVFGDEKNKSQGDYKFLQADLLFRPIRVTDNTSKDSYILATTKEAITGFVEKVQSLNGKADAPEEIWKAGGEAIWVEGNGKPVRLNRCVIQDEKWKALTPREFVIVDNLKCYDLPVIARNSLDENGISTNLWYEEFVPHESVFGMIILTPDDMDTDFLKAITSEPVQFGGNASIGYGLMQIREVK